MFFDHRLLISIGLILLGLVLGACSTVPHTGRSQLNLVSSDQLASASAQQFDQLKTQSKLITSGPQYDMVQRVGKRIAAAASDDMPNADWEFILIDDDDTVNAFAMPGGKVAVYTGIFKDVQSDGDLAIIIGHEVAHVVAGHGAERYSQQILAQGGLSAAQIGLGASGAVSDSEGQLIMAAAGAGTQLGVLLPYSRLHESEADEIGLIYAAKAGYDPRAAIGVWERMGQLSAGAPPEFLSTHPASTTRIADFQKLMPEAMKIYEQNKR